MKKLVIIIVGIILAAVIIFLILSFTHNKVEVTEIKENTQHKVEDSEVKKSTQNKVKDSGIKEISVDVFAADPERYPGYIGLTGTVISIDASNHFFSVGCADACINIPVKYHGTMPQMNTNIVVYGSLKIDKGQFYFDGKEIKNK